MADALFELKNVQFSYLGRIPALCGVDLTVAKGSRIAVIGANGSGKSTLLQMLDGLIFPDQGSIRAFGMELKEGVFCDEDFSANFRKRVGLVFQNPDVQLFCPTVKEDILFGPLQLGLDRKKIEGRFAYLVEALAIQGLLERPPHQLSIGEKRKVAIASVLIMDPEVLILDEPTAGLDPLTTRHIIDLLCDPSSDKTLITSTHDLHIVEEISNVVYVFGQDKRIVASGEPDKILKDEDLLRQNNLVHIHRHRHENKTHAHPHLHIEHHG